MKNKKWKKENKKKWKILCRNFFSFKSNLFVCCEWLSHFEYHKFISILLFVNDQKTNFECFCCKGVRFFYFLKNSSFFDIYDDVFHQKSFIIAFSPVKMIVSVCCLIVFDRIDKINPFNSFSFFSFRFLSFKI